MHLKSVKEEDRTTGEREAMTVVQKIVDQGQITVALAQKGKIVVPAQRVATSQIDLKIVDRDPITGALVQKDRIADQDRIIADQGRITADRDRKDKIVD